MFAGIDYSMSSPAVTVSDGTNYYLYALSKKKSYIGDYNYGSYNIYIGQYPKEDDFYKRAKLLGEWVSDIFNKHSVVGYTIEGYAFSGHGLTRNGEHGGILKYILMTTANVNPVEKGLPPKQVKKHFCSSGSADKFDMCKEFERLTGVELHSMFGFNYSGKTIPAPFTDLVDSFAMYEYAKANNLFSSN